MPTTYDFSFKMDRNGKSVLTSGGEHVRGVATMLFAMVPGTDEYNPEMGLDLNGRKFKMYEEFTRDIEYENEIRSQFTTYTDLVPVEIMAIYVKNSLYISLTVKYMSEVFNIQVSSDTGANMDELTSLIINRNDFNIK